MTLWRPEEPAGHDPFCVHPDVHAPSAQCAADPTDPPTMQGQPSKGWVAAHTEHRAAFPSVVIEGLKSDVVLDSFGFYVRPKFSPYVSPHTACKSVARQWMNAYDDDLPPSSTVALGARQARS
jgi:hypothetical protein